MLVSKSFSTQEASSLPMLYGFINAPGSALPSTTCPVVRQRPPHGAGTVTPAYVLRAAPPLGPGLKDFWPGKANPR